MSEIQSIIDWLETFPKFKKTFDVTKEGTDQLIDFLGTEILDTQYYVRVGQKERRRNDYVLEVAKPMLKLLQRKQNADFLVDLQKWVSDQSVKGLVPVLGNHGRQKAWVDAQQYIELDESNEVGLYQVQLHIEYTTLE